MPEIPAAWIDGNEPEYWLVLDSDMNIVYSAGWKEACHEHINDAINEFDIEGADKWKVRQAKLIED